MMIGKRGAMELSMGTIVTIVLLMSVLVLGLVLVRTIFTGSIDAVRGINTEVERQIQDTFNDNPNAKIGISPTSRLVTIPKGNEVDLGFAFNIRNTETTEGVFTYTITSDGVQRQDCTVRPTDAESWIIAGDSGRITMPPGSVMENSEFVRFRIPSSAPPCLVRYYINVQKDGATYIPPVSVDVQVQSE